MKLFRCLGSLILLTTFSQVSKAAIFDHGQAFIEEPEASVPVSPSVAFIFTESGLKKSAESSYRISRYRNDQIPNTPVNDALRKLCPGELFSTDTRAESLKGSGVLITPRHLLVPGHLFDETEDNEKNDCREKKFVFGYQGQSEVPESNVYTCHRVLNLRKDADPNLRPEEYGESVYDGHMDYAIIELDRAVENASVVRLNPDPRYNEGDQLYFYSSLGGLDPSLQRVSIKKSLSGAMSTDASTSNGSSGGIYLDDRGFFVGMHVSSYPGSTETDLERNCKIWRHFAENDFPWQEVYHSNKRGIDRPRGSIMMTARSLKSLIDQLQKNEGDYPAQVDTIP